MAPALLHELFADAVRRDPDARAVEEPDGRIVTYAELDRRAAAVAAALGGRVAPDTIVALLLPRGADLLAAQLGVLRAGGAWTAIDPGAPDARARFVLEDAACPALLTDATRRPRARSLAPPGVRVLDVHGPAPATKPAEAVAVGPRDLAYVIYTSGTTGRPKGVLIEHRGIVNLVISDRERFGLGPADRVAQGSSAAYDSSVEEVWLALASGATVVILDDETARSGPDLIPWLRRKRITVFCPPPSQLRATGCEDPASALPGLRLVYVGGEPLPPDLADRWARGRWLENGYGPTECTVTVVRARHAPGRPVVIGRPIRGHEAHVLDPELEPVADGEAGELCLAGPGLARGYLHLPDLTAARFPEHPRFGRIYRTGDRVRRDAAGDLVFLGRLDAQVKLRGHRIELEAIEARLAACDGVREAACAVQEHGGRQTLVAALVASDPDRPPPEARLRARLAAELPEVMVPARMAFVDALPRTVGGKLDRRALPPIVPALAEAAGGEAPRDALERRLAEAFAAHLGIDGVVPRDADFFVALGGDSLRAAEVISRLRGDPETEGLTVRDVYEAPTVRGLAARARAIGGSAPAPERRPAGSRRSPFLAGLVQAAWLVGELLAGGLIAWALTFRVLPWLLTGIEPVPLLLLAPLLGSMALLVWLPAGLGIAVAAKRVLVGRYVPGCHPAWGGFHLRHWILLRIVRVVPWGFVEGTVFQATLLRALGARVGRRVHLHRGIDLRSGGWDLLEIGDEASVGQDAALRLVALEAGQLVVGPVSLGPRSTVEVRAGVDAHASLAAGARLAPLSWLEAGRRVPADSLWRGIPAAPAGAAPPAPEVDRSRDLSPAAHGLRLMLARGLLGWCVALPALLGLAAVAGAHGVDGPAVRAWLERPALDGGLLWALILPAVAGVPAGLLVAAAALRLLGRIAPGDRSRWSPDYLRVWLESGVVEAAGRWLSGTLLWPRWLRLVGMEVGADCEVSTIVDVVPEQVAIGAGSFFADGIYLGGPIVDRGTVRIRPVRVGSGTFLGNHAVLPPGTVLQDDVLLGVCTVAGDFEPRPGSSWFGHPAFPLPRREVVAVDRRLTHDPGPLRRLTRWTWELLRFVLPAAPAPVLLGWVALVSAAAAALDPLRFHLLGLPLATAAAVATGPVAVLGLKWSLLGRVTPGIHPLWSCWCSRWDFLYVAWGRLARAPLGSLEGTPLLAWYLRAMGARIGRGVVLGGGFAQVVDPDMLRFEDGATVGAMFQAHSFEDRVLKIGPVVIGGDASVEAGAVLFYGAHVGAGARVRPHAVVMKNERLPPGRTFAGCPVARVSDRTTSPEG